MFGEEKSTAIVYFSTIGRIRPFLKIELIYSVIIDSLSLIVKKP